MASQMPRIGKKDGEDQADVQFPSQLESSAVRVGGGIRTHRVINEQASFDAFLSPFPLASFYAFPVLLLPCIQRRMAGAREDAGYLRIRAT